jgi:hypothetical protein
MRASTTRLLPGLIAVAATTVFGMPPTTGAKWWSTDPNLDCTAFHSLIHEIALTSGGKGYACGVTGTFVWLAAGGNWKTSLRMAAPASGAVGVQYIFYDADGRRLSLDTISGSVAASGDTVTVALNANQPVEIQLLGASSDAPQYSATQTGSVFAIFFCPDAATCATVLPQLMYSSAPLKPWLITVPIAWDSSFSFLQPSGLSTRWAVTGSVDDTRLISFAIYNPSSTPATYTIRAYDSGGSLVGEAVTPLISGGNGAGGAGSTRAFLLTDLIKSVLSAGILKVTVEGTSPFSASFLQFSGDSAVSLQSAYDSAPAASTHATSAGWAMPR